MRFSKRIANYFKAPNEKPSSLLRSILRGDSPTATGRRAMRSVWVWRVGEVAANLSAARPYFRMRCGSTYAVGKTHGVPTHFIRVDKNDIPPKIRKRQRRAARLLAEATK